MQQARSKNVLVAKEQFLKEPHSSDLCVRVVVCRAFMSQEGEQVCHISFLPIWQVCGML